MKNIHLTSQRIMFRILLVVVLSTIAGFLLPMLSEDFPPFDAAISSPLALLAWSVFRLVAPNRYDRKWTIAEFTLVPIAWLSLMLAFNVWFHQLSQFLIVEHQAL